MMVAEDTVDSECSGISKAGFFTKKERNSEYHSLQKKIYVQ